MHARGTSPVWRLLFALLAVALLAAACGNDDEDDGAAPGDDVAPAVPGDDNGEDDAGADYDPDGVIRIASGILPTAATTQFDPVQLLSPANIPQKLVYGTLLTARMDGSYDPGLAESAEVVDDRTITIQIREGVVFSDGTPFDAEAVKFGLDRNFASENPGAFAIAEFQAVEEVTVDGPLTVSIHFSAPVAGSFYHFLALGETMIVSPTAVEAGVDLQTNPVGAGPFVLESLEMERRMVFTKNDLYWDADNVRVARVEFVHIAGPEAQINAMQTDTIDIIHNSPVQTREALAGIPGIHIEAQASDSNLFWGAMCKSDPPLDDVRVRQALNYALDRDQLNEVIFDGRSLPMWGVNTPDNPYHDPALQGVYERDLDRARELLEDAGYPDGFSIEAIVPAAGAGGGQSDSVRFTELVQGQWAEVGVDVVIVPSANFVGEFFIENQYPLLFFDLQQVGLHRITRTLVPGSIGNVCNWDDPELNALVDQIRPLAPDSPEAIELWHQLDAHLVETAAQIFGVFGIQGTIWNEDRLGNVNFWRNFQGQPMLDLELTYVKR
jgi:peptide/nickel transport system substrate-binding protein